MSNNNETSQRFITLARLVALYPDAGLTVGGLRWARFRNTNGFNRCIRKFGRRILVDRIAFEEWLSAQTES